MRKLAEKTMGATKEVGENISAIQTAAQKSIHSMDSAVNTVEKTTTLSHDSGTALGNILTYAKDNADQAQSIATAAEEQSAASEQISQAIEEVTRISEETSRGQAESTQAVQQLAAMSGDLRAIVDQLKRS